jgi:23S rRNA (cytidine1920-2'-O)/16S rRNA (cytidine1409-2'-O)-methyltransferase
MKSFHRRTARPAPVPSVIASAPVDRAGRMRVDALLVERGMAQSRAAAQRLIAAGCVFANGVQVLKPSVEVMPDCLLVVKDR